MSIKLSKWHDEVKSIQTRTGLPYKKAMSLASQLRKNQHGGLFDKSKKVIPLPSTEYKFENYQLIGEGGFGVVARGETKSGPFAIKLIKSHSQCQSAKEEAFIHNEVYQTYLEFGEFADENSAYKILYIPKPLSYQEFPLQMVQIGHRRFESRCSYTMEYMSPIDIEINIFDNTPIQLHVAYASKEGFIEGNPYRGYMSGADLDSLLQRLDKKYPNKPKPTNSSQIYEAIGIAVGCAIFGSGYNPADFQFMISEYFGEFRLIGFDFGMFKKIKNYDKKTMSKIYTDLIYSPYIGAHFTDNIQLLPFMKGLASTVKPLIKLYGVDIPEYSGFKYLFDNFVDDYPKLEQYRQDFNELIEN